MILFILFGCKNQSTRKSIVTKQDSTEYVTESIVEEVPLIIGQEKDTVVEKERLYIHAECDHPNVTIYTKENDNYNGEKNGYL